MKFLKHPATAAQRVAAMQAGKPPVTSTEWGAVRRRLRKQGQPCSTEATLRAVRNEYWQER